MLKRCFKQGILEAGCDEAGRGCLAGPVFGAAVILPGVFTHPLLNDSKKLSERQRYSLREIIQKHAVAWAVAMADNEEIDQINISNASILAMHRAIGRLCKIPEHLIIDGNRFIPYNGIPYHTIVKGDGKYMSVAAASILAKTYRDDFMEELHSAYDMYGWNRNKGYPTREHRAAIFIHGITKYHRRSFNLLQYRIDF